MARNIWADVSAIAQRVESDAIFIIRQTNFLEPTIKTFNEMTGANIRRGYKYNNVTVNAIGDDDDLVSQAFTPEADQDLTPAEYGAQFEITDLRAESELPESILTDAATELGLGAADYVMDDIVGQFPSLTGGTVGASGSAITWAYMSAAISQAKNANKSQSKPLVAVIHEYQASVLATAASVAGGSNLGVPNTMDVMTKSGFTARWVFMGVPIYTVYTDPTDTDFNGAVYPREAIAIDWRRPVRIEPERNASRRSLELNMSMVYDTGVWRPDRGISILFAADAPTGV